MRSAAILLLLLLACAANAQTTTYSVPKKLPIDRVVRRAFPEYVGGAKFPHLIAEQFFPIGWAKDGKFAYYVEPVDEACGCYYAKLVIQDMVTDNVLWEFKYDQDDDRDPKTGEMKGEGDIKKLWRKNQKLFSDKLREHKIVASTSVLLGKTFTAAGRTYTAKAVTKMGKNPEGDERVDKLTLTLTSPKLGSKLLYSDDHSREEYWFVLDAGVIGVIKSPFENRVAVVALEVHRGWEGPPHTGDIRIAGADLTRGFGKQSRHYVAESHDL